MSSRLKSKSADMLFEAVLQLKTTDECYAFFEDLCTIHEICSMAQRLEVASLLFNGGTYTEIGEKTGASTATISRINRCLNYGEGGYKAVLSRLTEDKENKDNNAD